MQTAIVAEGGGQRGIYTAGVLDAFQQASFNPFNSGIGVSAGAQNLLAYFLEKPGYARLVITELTTSPEFFVPYRFVGSRSVIDLDGYFQQTQEEPRYQLPYSQIDAVQLRRRLTFVASDSEMLEPVYLDPDASNVVEHLKASSAIPFLYPPGVQLDQRHLVDGAVADPLPIERAYKQGAKRILLIRTVPAGADCVGWRDRLDLIRRLRALPVNLVEMLGCHEQAMLRTAAFLSNLPSDLELHVVAPETPLRSQLLGSHPEALLDDYRTGQMAGLAAIQSLASWIDPNAPVNTGNTPGSFFGPDVASGSITAV